MCVSVRLLQVRLRPLRGNVHLLLQGHRHRHGRRPHFLRQSVRPSGKNYNILARECHLARGDYANGLCTVPIGLNDTIAVAQNRKLAMKCPVKYENKNLSVSPYLMCTEQSSPHVPSFPFSHFPPQN